MSTTLALPVPPYVLARRKPGYEAELRRIGKVSPDGKIVTLTPKQFADLRVRFALPKPPCLTVNLSLENLRLQAGHRQPGFLEMCLKVGTLDAAGKTVSFHCEDWKEIADRYASTAPKISTPTKCC